MAVAHILAPHMFHAVCQLLAKLARLAIAEDNTPVVHIISHACVCSLVCIVDDALHDGVQGELLGDSLYRVIEGQVHSP